jgi:hypothetical protein
MERLGWNSTEADRRSDQKPSTDFEDFVSATVVRIMAFREFERWRSARRDADGG